MTTPSSMWIEKHKPNSLSKLTFHPELSSKLDSLSKCEEIPHLLFYGPPGAGKKTRVMALLKEIYGSGAEKVKLEFRNFKTPTGKAIEISTLGSNYHVECNAADAGGNNDRFVVQEVIKEIASHVSLSSSLAGQGARPFKMRKNPIDFTLSSVLFNLNLFYFSCIDRSRSAFSSSTSSIA